MVYEKRNGNMPFLLYAKGRIVRGLFSFTAFGS